MNITITNFDKLSKLLKKPFSKNPCYISNKVNKSGNIYVTLQHDYLPIKIHYRVAGYGSSDSMFNIPIKTLKELIAIQQPITIQQREIIVNNIHKQVDTIRQMNLDFEIQDTDKVEYFTYPAKDIVKYGNKCNDFVTKDRDRHILSFISLNNLRAIATDGRKVSYISETMPQIPDFMTDFLVPSDIVKIIDTHCNYELMNGEYISGESCVPFKNRYRLHFGYESFIFDYYTYKYPEAEKCFERERLSMQFYIGRQPLINVLSEYVNITNHGSFACSFEFVDGIYLELKPKNDTTMPIKLTYDESMKCTVGFQNHNQFIPKDFSIKFNGKSMATILSNMKSDFVVMEFGEYATSKSPIHFYETTPELNNNWYLLMPLRS